MPWIPVWYRLYYRLWAKIGRWLRRSWVGLSALPLSAWLWARYSAAGWRTGSDGKPFLPVRWWCTALPQVCARLRLIWRFCWCAAFLSASAWAANCPLPCRWSANMRRRKYAAVLLYCWKAFGAWAGSRPRWCLISLFRKLAGTARFYSAPCPCFMCRWC